MLRSKLIVLFVIGCLSACAQDLKKDAEKINAAYTGVKKMSARMEYLMYENYTTSVVYIKETGLMMRIGNNRYMKLDDIETVFTKDYSVVVDNEGKTISLLPGQKSSGVPASFLVNIDSLRQYCTKYTFSKESDGSLSYTFFMQEHYPDYRQIKISFDPKNYFLERMVLYCDEGDISTKGDEEKMSRPRIEIRYHEINTNPSFTEDEISFKRFLVKAGDRYTVKPEYKNYSFNDL